MTAFDRMHGNGSYRASDRMRMRCVAEARTVSHVSAERLAMCRAQIVDRDLQFATARAILFDTAATKRRAASRYVRALGFLLDPVERDIDLIAFDLFDKHPFPRPAMWDEP